MNQYTEDDIRIINSTPLIDILQWWGRTPAYLSKDGKTARFLCPWHDDHHPSLIVDRLVRNGADDCGFKCWACGESGYGAIQLAARLMGLPAGKVSSEHLGEVLDEIMNRCDVELQHDDTNDGKGTQQSSASQHIRTQRTSLIAPADFRKDYPAYAERIESEAIFEYGQWTVEGLRALGLRVEISARRVKKSDLADDAADGQTVGEVAIRIGDIKTDVDPESGLPLYRCSLGRGFYGGNADTRTVEEWGREVERLFGARPIARCMRRVETQKGGWMVMVTQSTRNYPIFVFEYPWAVKKYEPKSTNQNYKWNWLNKTDDADLDHRWYADAPLMDYLSDGVLPEKDPSHPMVEPRKDDDEKDGKKSEKPRFRRVVLCSGPRDAIAVWSHSNAHVVWLHSELSGFDKKGGNVKPNRWLRRLLKQLLDVTEPGGLYVCYDEDATGLASSQAIALSNPQVRWLRLPSELSRVARPADNGKNIKPLKDVTDFIQHFAETESLMPADLQHDDPSEWFDNAMFNTPSCQFWQWESARKDADGSERARYKFDLQNTPVFLRARGMVKRVIMQEGKAAFSRFFLLSGDNTYTELFAGEKGNNRLVTQARDLMADWLRAHKEYNDQKGALSRSIYSAKLEQCSLEAVEQVAFDEHSWGDDFDYFFFENTAVRVTKDEITATPYDRLPWLTNSNAILDGRFTPQRQSWRVIVNPKYESERQAHEDTLASFSTSAERQQENMRWAAWESLWKYLLILDRPMDEMPPHFRFLYNTCRIFWEQEQDGTQLSATERQVQDMYFVSMLHAIGSALVRHRSASRQQFVHITDNGTRREDLASGGTGKTAILELLGLVRRVLKVDGKALEGGNISMEMELNKVVPGLHSIVCIDELPAGFSPKKLYNYTLSVTSRGLYKESLKLEGDDLPKFVLASNEQIDLSSDSTSRRAYQVLVGDWYHPRSMDGSRPSHTPADDFRAVGLKEIARNLHPALLNQVRNLLLGCVQLFFQFPEETIIPPKDSRAMLRQALAASRDEQFTRWIAHYLSDSRHLGEPIAQQELAISLLDYCGTVVGEKTLKSAYKRIRENLDDFLRTSVYVCDPPVVLLTATDREKHFRRCPAWMHQLNADKTIATDERGERLPRVLDKSNPPRCYYFYRKNAIPRHFYDPAHEGDNDYVQGASSIDPEREPTAGCDKQ